MSLDQNIYRCKKVDQSFVDQYLRQSFISHAQYIDIEDMPDYRFLSKEDLEDSPDLKEIATPVKVEFEYLNIKKLFLDNFPKKKFEDYYQDGTEYCGTTVYHFRSLFDDNDCLMTKPLTVKDIAKYLFKQLVDTFVLYCHEECFFHKEYFLQHWLRESEWNYTGNCVFKKISLDVISRLLEDLKDLHDYSIGGEIPGYLERKFNISEHEKERGAKLDPDTVEKIIYEIESVKIEMETDSDAIFCYYEWY